MKPLVRSLYGLFLFIFFTVIVQAANLPDNSIYHIDSSWLNQNKEELNIASLQSRVQVVAFVYTYCEHSCPVILAKLKFIEKNISPEHKDSVNFLLVTLDPERDTPEVLNAYMKKKGLDETRWQMFSGDPEDVLELSALVGVRYRPMNNKSGDISHSNMITVLDRKGRLHYQMKGLDVGLEQVLAEIAVATQEPD